MKHDEMFTLCVKLVRGETATADGVAACRRRVWRQSSHGVQCDRFVDSFEAARAFIKLKRKCVQWL